VVGLQVARRYRSSVHRSFVVAAATLIATAAAPADAVSFAARHAVPAALHGAAVATADFNRDGRADVAVAFTDAGGVSVFLATPQDDMTTVGPFSTGRGPAAVVAADINGDDRVDLVVANGLDNTVSLLLGHGDGTFAAARDIGSASAPSGLAAADVDRDGRTDVAVTSLYDDALIVLHANADGSFTPAATRPCRADRSAWRRPTSIATARWTSSPASMSTTARLDRARQRRRHLRRTGARRHRRDAGPPLVADLTGDGMLDIAAAATNDDAIALLRGRGDGSFDPAVRLPVGAFPAAIAAADLDHDGAIDLVSADCLPTRSACSAVSATAPSLPGAAAAGHMPVALTTADVDRSRSPTSSAWTRWPTRSRCSSTPPIRGPPVSATATTAGASASTSSSAASASHSGAARWPSAWPPIPTPARR
jgi:hypothetical protein